MKLKNDMVSQSTLGKNHSIDQIKIGDFIEVIEVKSSQQRKRKHPYRGEVSFIDPKGLMYGTWGFVIDPAVDTIKKM